MPKIVIPYLVTLHFELSAPWDVDDFTAIGPMPYDGKVLSFSGHCNSPGSGTGPTSFQLLANTRGLFSSHPYFDPNTSHQNSGYILEGGELVEDTSFVAGEHLKLNVQTINDGFDVLNVAVDVVTRMYKEVNV
jgi:hypothetical protein